VGVWDEHELETCMRMQELTSAGLIQPGIGGLEKRRANCMFMPIICLILLNAFIMKKRFPLPKLALSAIVLLFFVLSFSRCTKKTIEIIYRDTTVNVTKDTTIVLDSSDHQTYISFLTGGINTTSTTPTFAGVLPFFDKTRYPGADSIIFCLSGYNYSNNSGPAGSLIAELYDSTDDQVIAGSQVTISDPAPTTSYQHIVFHASGNVLAALPAKQINLQILVSSSASDNNAVAMDAFLLIYK
jgi:hypothetical protein